MNKTVGKVRRYIIENNLLPKHIQVVVAVSGGADSMVLLHILMQLRREFSWNLHIAHVNHNLRGEESDRDMFHVVEFCERYGLTHTVYSVDVADLAKRQNKGLEDMGREVRYSFFRRNKQPMGKIVTAHTQNDNVETVLMRFIRGASLNGLTGIPMINQDIVRPILCLTRAEVEAYAELNSIPYIHDSTNFENDYTRNKLRNVVIPMIEQLNPNFCNTLSNNIETYAQDNVYIEGEIRKYLRKCTGVNGLTHSIFTTVPRELKCRFIRAYLEQLKHQKQYTNLVISKQVITLLCERLVQQDFKSFDIAGGYTVCSIDNRIYIMQKKQTQFTTACEPNEIPLTDTVSTYMCGEMQILVTKERLSSLCKVNFNKCANIFCLPAEFYDITQVVLRGKKQGDKFKLSADCSQKIHKTLPHMTEEERNSLYMLCATKEVLWIPNYKGTPIYSTCVERDYWVFRVLDAVSL